MSRKMVSAATITTYQKQQRLEFAFDQVIFTPFERCSVVSLAMIKFNLDGPDWIAFYWPKLRTDERLFSRRNHVNGSVMVWPVFLVN